MLCGDSSCKRKQALGEIATRCYEEYESLRGITCDLDFYLAIEQSTFALAGSCSGPAWGIGDFDALSGFWMSSVEAMPLTYWICIESRHDRVDVDPQGPPRLSLRRHIDDLAAKAPTTTPIHIGLVDEAGDVTGRHPESVGGLINCQQVPGQRT